jgi:hypothetical protein
MSGALDRFGDSLVRASEDLYRAGGSPMRRTAEPIAGMPFRRWIARAGRRLGRHPWRVFAGVLAVGALSAAGSTLFGPRGNPRTILSIQCAQRIVESASGSPVNDCRALWRSLYHEPAPHLTAWVADSGGAVVVVPTGSPPAGDSYFHWRRLPPGWTQDRAAVVLSHQLQDISTGLEARACWSASSVQTLVRSALRTDDLGSWRIEVRGQPGIDAEPPCLTVTPIVQVASHSVAVIERLLKAPAHGSFRTPAGATELKRVADAEREVNRDIATTGGQCMNAHNALALWRQSMKRIGLAEDRYVLLSSSQAGLVGGCARFYVTAPGGGGPYSVYLTD